MNPQETGNACAGQPAAEETGSSALPEKAGAAAGEDPEAGWEQNADGEPDWKARALAAEQTLERLRAQAEEMPRIVTGGGNGEEYEFYSREDVAAMSPQEINSRWQGIKNSLKRWI